MTEQLCPVSGAEFQYIRTNGIRMRVVSAGGSGPWVLLAHGWPESWYNWRHQIPFLVDQGYRVVVPEMRGYGETDSPQEVSSFDVRHLCDDIVGVLDALDAEQAVLIGHDWGAIVAWYSVLYYPERFRALVAMSVPYGGRPRESIVQTYKRKFGENFFYMLYHNAPGGIAEAEYDADPYGLLSRLYLSPDSPRHPPEITEKHHTAGGWIKRMGAPKGLPSWLRQDDLEYVVNQFRTSGFRGGVNYYRNLHRNWELTAELDPVVRVPTLFIAGEKDMVIAHASPKQLQEAMARVVPDLRNLELFPGIGHWVQQEAPEATNAALGCFLGTL
ncbi:MAG: alpha/beta hydrolase [Gammaproteobacteria bacterium]|nr:alpha/beta hydrolase [Gammaproteobacteria bacterium]MCY4358136.1 alpha/beta hydrolase [Gammaproteobacteria bacterium]